MKICIAFSGTALALSQTKEIEHLSKEQHQKAKGKLDVSFKYFLKTLLPYSIFSLVNSDTLATSTYSFREYTQAFAQVFSFCPALFLVFMDLLYDLG